MKVEKRDPIDFLVDILDSIENIENFLKDLILKSFPRTQKQYIQWYELLRLSEKQQKICQIA
jgi:uncharacterized protein with HEPN domain